MYIYLILRYSAGEWSYGETVQGTINRRLSGINCLRVSALFQFQELTQIFLFYLFVFLQFFLTNNRLNYLILEHPDISCNVYPLLLYPRIDIINVIFSSLLKRPERCQTDSTLIEVVDILIP